MLVTGGDSSVGALWVVGLAAGVVSPADDGGGQLDGAGVAASRGDCAVVGAGGVRGDGVGLAAAVDWSSGGEHVALVEPGCGHGPRVACSTWRDVFL